MQERGQAPRRPTRAPLPQRSRKRWLAAAIVAACWLALLDLSGSVVAATMLLAFLAGLGVVTVLSLRALGLSRDHPWVRRMAARPWRDGQDVLRLALRHLSEVFIVTPSGSLIAPELVELRLNPDDLSSLTERMDVNLIAESAAEVYEEQVAASGARFAGAGPARVQVISDPAVPEGRYRIRQGQPVDAGFAARGGAAEFAQHRLAPAYAGAAGSVSAGSMSASSVSASSAASGAAVAGAGGPGFAASDPHQRPSNPYRNFVGHDGNTRSGPEAGTAPVAGAATVIELNRGQGQVPVLRLVTDGSVAETRVSGARAGRGTVELALPEVPTVSREHARFTFSSGQWWVSNLGRNGLTLNGTALVGEQPVAQGDVIRWGMRSDALQSRVEIG
jgi:hypothetical protein